MGTLMTCVVVHPVVPGLSCQTVSLLPLTASASKPPPGPGASAAVPGGTAGSARQVVPGLLMVSAWPSVRTAHAVPSAPKPEDRTAAAPSRSGAETVQCAPPSLVRAVSRLTAVPVPATSSASLPAGVLVSRSTSVAVPASGVGREGPAACQLPAV